MRITPYHNYDSVHNHTDQIKQVQNTWIVSCIEVNIVFCPSKPRQENMHQENFIISNIEFSTSFCVKLPWPTAAFLFVNNTKHWMAFVESQSREKNLKFESWYNTFRTEANESELTEVEWRIYTLIM